MTHRSLLIHLAEEGGEVTQAALKLDRFGTPTDTRNLECEVGDLLSFVDLLVKRGVLNRDSINEHRKMKFKKYKEMYKGVKS